MVVLWHVDGTFEFTVGIVRRSQRTHRQDVVQSYLRTGHFTITVVAGQTKTEVVTHTLVEVGTHRVAVKALGRHHAIVVIVTCTEAIAAAVGTARHADIMTGKESCLEKEILPVGVDVIRLVNSVFKLPGILAELGKLRAVHHRILMEELRETDVGVVADLCRSTHSSLDGGDHDHAVGTTRTVDGRSRSILEDVHALDVCRIDV